jgi:hypothetical protein
MFNNFKGLGGTYHGDECNFNLTVDGYQRLVVEYNVCNHLPVGYATIGRGQLTIRSSHANLALCDDTNQIITGRHKLLLNWRERFGHLNFLALQGILQHFPFQSAKFAATSKCDLTDFRCAICQHAKAHRCPTHGHYTKPNEDCIGRLTTEHLLTADQVLVDHFESRILDQTKDSYGKLTSNKYVCRCIFVDHATGYLHVENQLAFLLSKPFEQGKAMRIWRLNMV